MGDATAKQLDMAASGDCVAAVWDEYRADARRRVVMTSSTCGGAKGWSAPRPLSSPGADASYPVVVATARGLLAAWTERGASGEVAWRSQVLSSGRNAAAR
jgi:hypothetical protein